jgi:hypothetical protein
MSLKGVVMPQSQIAALFDTTSEEYKSAIKKILKDGLNAPERRIAVIRICPETQRPVSTGRAEHCRASAEEVQAVVDKIIRLLKEKNVPRRS